MSLPRGKKFANVVEVKTLISKNTLTTKANRGKDSMEVVGDELKYMEEKVNRAWQGDHGSEWVRHQEGECQSVMFDAECSRWSACRDGERRPWWHCHRNGVMCKESWFKRAEKNDQKILATAIGMISAASSWWTQTKAKGDQRCENTMSTLWCGETIVAVRCAECAYDSEEEKGGGGRAAGRHVMQVQRRSAAKARQA